MGPSATDLFPFPESRAALILASQRRLRSSLLNDRNAIGWAPARDFAAHLLLELDNPQVCWELASEWLRETFDADRVDASPGQPEDPIYSMGFSESLRPDAEVPSVRAVAISDADRLLRIIWGTPRPIVFGDLIPAGGIESPLRDVFVYAKVHKKIAVSLRADAKVFGLLCMDRGPKQKLWTKAQYERFDMITRRILGPVLWVALELSRDTAREGPASVDIESRWATLTNAERRVLKMAERGLSYKEIASELQRSIFTIDHQLRSIRAKFSVKTNSQLISYLKCTVR